MAELLLPPGTKTASNFGHLRDGLVGILETEGIYSVPVLLGGPRVEKGLSVVSDSTTINGVLGHLLEGEVGYTRGIPLERVTSFDMILANKTAALHEDQIRSKVRENGSRTVVAMMGGEDLGKLFKGNQYTATLLSKEYGNINELRDAIDKIIAEAALSSDAFISATCRGWQVIASLMGLELVELGNTHRDENTQNNFRFTRVAPVLDHTCLNNPLYIEESYCNHHEGVLLGDPRWTEVTAQTGWRPYYVSLDKNEVTENSTVEIAVKVNGNGEIEGVATQGHDEKNQTFDGYKTLEWRNESIERRLDAVLAA